MLELFDKEFKAAIIKYFSKQLLFNKLNIVDLWDNIPEVLRATTTFHTV